MLAALHRSRTPLLDSFPLATNVDLLRSLARRAADPAVHEQLRVTLAQAAGFGAGRCHDVVLLAGDGDGAPGEAIPWPDGDAALLLDRIDNDTRMSVALAGAVAALTRWGDPDSRTAVTRDVHHGWDRWQSARDVPLREWIYTEGVALHLAHALQPLLVPHELLGLTHAAFGRLRQREKVFRSLLAVDLDQRGVGLVLRWLTPDAPATARTVGDVVLPPMAGQYLAWRMVEERVGRVGIRDALRAES